VGLGLGDAKSDRYETDKERIRQAHVAAQGREDLSRCGIALMLFSLLVSALRAIGLGHTSNCSFRVL
jgi:hypothetical protein